MKILKPILLLSTLFIFAACKKDDGTPEPNPTPVSTANSWKLTNYTFSRSTSAQILTTYGNGDPFTQVNVDSQITNANGSFKSCNLVFWFNTNTEGIYTATSTNTLASFTNLKYMHIRCVVTDAAGSGAVYELTNDPNISINVEKINNQFVVTANDPITLSKTQDDGLANAPATMTFTSDHVQ